MPDRMPIFIQRFIFTVILLYQHQVYILMSKQNDLKFPQFECIISDTMEDYDSEVEMFFLLRNMLSSELSKLRFSDKEWKVNYENMIQYLHDLTDSFMDLTEPPSYQFLIDLSMGDELEDDTLVRLKNAPSPTVADLVRASTMTREMMFWYVRNGKNNKFSRSFNPQRFQGLPFLKLVLSYRSINLSKRK